MDRAVIVTQAEDSAMALDQSIKSEKMLKGFKKFSDITNSSQKRCFGYSNSTNPYLLKPPQRLKTVRHKPIDVEHDDPHLSLASGRTGERGSAPRLLGRSNIWDSSFPEVSHMFSLSFHI